MKSLVVKRSIVVAGHKTSVTLEDAFWNGMKEIASGRNITLSDLVTAIDSERRQGNLSSAIRLFVLDFYRNQLVDVRDGRDDAEGHPNENTTTNPLSAQYENELGVFNGLIFTPTQLDFQFHFDSIVPLIDVFGPSGNMSILDFQSGRLGPLNGTGIGLRIGSDPFLTSPMNGGDTVQIGVAVPGPIAGAGLPGLIAACGVLLALARRRLKIASFA